MAENNEPTFQNKVGQLFGEKALSHAIFYNHENSLRFELSEGDSYIEQFQAAFQKSSRILKYAFKNSENLFVCLSFYSDSVRFLDNLSVFKELQDCGISIPRDSYTTWQTHHEDDDAMRLFISYPLKLGDLDKHLWGVLAQELGIRPAFQSSLYLIDFDKKIIAHPYDDRGMDIIGSNIALLTDLYRTFYDYLLDYDLDQMKKSFGEHL